MAQKISGKSLSYRKRKKVIKVAKTQTGNKRLYETLRLKEKAANERMRQLEKADIKSPAYLAVQAKLEILGKTRKGQRGRRFSETGRATYNEMEYLSKILDEFLGQETSKVTGARKYYDTVWSTANDNNKLSELGITKDMWLDFWETFPDNKKDRMYYSQSVKIFKAYMRKNGQLSDENKLTPEQIAEIIKNGEDLSHIYSDLGVTLNEVAAESVHHKGQEK